MEILKYGFLGLLCITVLLILIFAIKSRKFAVTLLINAVLGIGALAVIDLTSSFTGVYIPINYWTAASGCVLGLPGVLGFLLLNFIFI